MNFRRLMLIVLPLLGAVFLFMILRYFYIDWESTLASRNSPSEGAGLVHPEVKDAMEFRKGFVHLGSTGINLLQKDKNGLPEMQLLADKIIYPTGTTAAITGLRILFFHTYADRPPEILTMMADHAEMVTKGALTNVSDLETAHLWGNTVLVDDRGTPDDHSDDILMGFQDLNFDNARQQLTTDGPVVVAGLEMNMTARKMRIALKSTTGKGFQIEKMTFLEDIFISLESKDRSLRGMAGPTTQATSTARPAAVAAAPGPARGSPTLSAPTTKAAPKSSRAPGDRVELWKIDLDGAVDARQGAQRVLGDHVTLFNGSAATGGSAAANAAPAGPDASATSPAKPARAPAAGGPPLNTEGSAAARAAFLKADALPPLDIIATGPLDITPISADQRQTLGDEANLMIVTGRPVIIDEDQTHVVGEEVRYNSRTQVGSIMGRETPFIVDQPGRMYLTDLGQLDFKNNPPGAEIAATALIRGEGQLHAVAQAGSFSGAGRRKAAAPDAGAPATIAVPVAAAVPAASEPPSTIDASWTQGVRLEFYRLPTEDKKAAVASGAAGATGTSATGTAAKGAGEIKRAEFYGAAELKHPEGILQGDALAMDFFKPEPGRGQAIEHLLARGNVHAKSSPTPTTAATALTATDTKKGSPKMNVGDITCQKELDVHFTRDAAGNTQTKDLKASGAVTIKEPEGRILAENLDVRFGTSTSGQTEPQYVDARGNVLIDRTDLYAEGDHILQNQLTGEVLMEGRPEKPAQARRGATRIVAPHIEFTRSEKDGVIALATGVGEMEMPSATDLRGIPHATPAAAAAASATGTAKAAKPTEPLIVRWTDRMQFVDKQNYALFRGNVRASTGGSGLTAGQLWIYFADKPPVEPVAGAPAKAKPKSDAADPWGGFGAKDKDIVSVLAEKNVHTLDLQLAADKTVQSVMEMTCGDNLKYVQPPTTTAGGPAKGRISINGPGELQLLTREKTKAGEEAGVGLAPEAVAAAWKGVTPTGYSRTHITWAERMAYEDASHRAYFEGNVDALTVGRSSAATAEADRTGKSTIEMRIKSHDLQVVFAAKKSAATATGSAAGSPSDTVASAARPSGPPSSATPTDDRQAIDKMAAGGKVFLWVAERRGSADHIIYQKDPELLRLYGGTEDWARLWEENEAKQEFGETVAETITYEPSTKNVSFTGLKSMSGSPESKPAPKTPPKSTSSKSGKGVL